MLLDQRLEERLVDVLLGGRRERTATLTETCDGLIATWQDAADGQLRAVALDTLGRVRSQVRSVPREGSITWSPSAIWDGEALTRVDGDYVLELDVNAELLTRTPAPGVLAAVGTDEGMLVLTRSAVGDSSVQVLERGSGRILQHLGVLEPAVFSGAGAVGIDGGVSFFTNTRSGLPGVAVADVLCVR